MISLILFVNAGVSFAFMLLLQLIVVSKLYSISTPSQRYDPNSFANNFKRFWAGAIFPKLWFPWVFSLAWVAISYALVIVVSS